MCLDISDSESLPRRFESDKNYLKFLVLFFTRFATDNKTNLANCDRRTKQAVLNLMAGEKYFIGFGFIAGSFVAFKVALLFIAA